MEFSLKQLILICIALSLLFGVVLGFAIGMSKQLEFDNKILNETANSDIHLLRDGNKYYSIHPYNVSMCDKDCLLNYTIIKD